MPSPLDAFAPATRAWFTATLGEPTPPQAQGWPAIQRGDHTLILAPTGSGKTLAAFLSGIDALYRDAAAEKTGIRLLYISPLKALNNDIERNLRAPLGGIRAQAQACGQTLPELRVAVRTGDTPAAARAHMLKSPPDILITTPESLYLMLTSPRARLLFRGVRTVIVDEIHTLCGNKRGAHLALSLERLGQVAQQPVQRIGLSATVRPPEVAAHFLGGNDAAAGFAARPVTIIDAHYRKAIELDVITVVEDFRELPASSIWPSVIPRVLADMYRHRSTLIFANNRRLAERTADRLNAQLQAVRDERIEPDSLAVLAPEGIARDRGMFAIGAEGPIRAHHGSMSKEARREMEEDLKSGRLPALVGTSSLELGIDIGTVDLVVQLQSPKSVAQGLQRVGRSGHRVGETSRGRIYATFREDLVEAAAIVRGMLDGDVERTAMPHNALDVLAQQIVAMVANEDWRTDSLFDVLRGAAPYQSLVRASFESVLDMLSGKFFFAAEGVRAAASLRAKIAYDRVNQRLTALPGSRMLAIGNAGTIPDSGQFGAYLSDGKTRIGDLEEEFVYETRVGDAFLLGSKVWRVTEITADRVIVSDAAGATPRMPFWNGDYPHRPYELGARIGAFRREVMEKLDADMSAAELGVWLKNDFHLDDNSVANLIDHFQRQRKAVGVMSSDRQIVVEQFVNEVGDPYLVIQSPFGGRVNAAWALALSSMLTEQTGVTPEMQAHDDGIIFRLRETGLAAAQLLRALSASDARERILRELPASPVFGAQFRMNAGRALLLPRRRGGKRTPFWLQRLRAKDLLALTLKSADFPIVAETYRDCLRDVFDMPHLEHVLHGIADGSIAVTPIHTVTPSPIAAGLLFDFTAQFLYEWDAPKAERQLQALSLPRQALADVLNGAELGELLRPEAVDDVTQRAQHRATGTRARSAEELSLLLQELGDLSAAEIADRCAGVADGWRQALTAQGRLFAIDIAGEQRWIAAEHHRDYAQGFAQAPDAAARVLRRHLRHAGPITHAELQARYGFDPVWLDAQLATLIAAREVLGGVPRPDQVIDAEAYARMHSQTLTILRREVQAVPFARYADFLARWQGAHPAAQSQRADTDEQRVRQLRGVCLPAQVWINDVLPARLRSARESGSWAALRTAEGLVWSCAGGDARRLRVRLFPRGEGALFVPAAGDAELAALAPNEQAVLNFLRGEGASFAAEVQTGTRLSAAQTAAALESLARAGYATNDDFETLQQLLDGAPAQMTRAVKPVRSSLEADLAQRLGPGFERPLSHSTYRDAKRRVRARLATEQPATAPNPRTTHSRWSAVHRTGILGAALGDEARTEAIARVLLQRYGVLARDCLAHEEINADWAMLYRVLERLELRGEVRRGYFVEGLSGLQFALPEAVELLRTPQSGDSVVLLNAQDPANLYGGARFARLAGTHVVLRDGQLLVLFEDGGARITTADGAPGDAVARALAAYFSRPGAAQRSAVTQWNNSAVGESDGVAHLRALGFQRTPTGMEKWI